MLNQIYRTICFLLLFSIVYSSTKGQNKLELIKAIPLEADQIYSDHIGNVYIVNDAHLIKCDSLGNEKYNYSKLQYGDISSIDVSNPLKILVFYRAFNTIVYLDNTLSPQASSIDLSDISPFCSHVCRSYQNGIWVYESLNAELVRYDQYMNESLRSGNIQMLVGETISVKQMQEVSNTLYIRADEGIFVFDRYGSFLRKYPFENTANLKVINRDLYFLNEKKLYHYNTETLNLEILDLTDFNAEFISFNGSYLYLYTDNSIRIIQIIND